MAGLESILYLSFLNHVYLLESSFFLKVIFKKLNYFPMFGSIMKNKLDNNLHFLVMS
jgi:hypothetical protein